MEHLEIQKPQNNKSTIFLDINCTMIKSMLQKLYNSIDIDYYCCLGGISTLPSFPVFRQFCHALVDDTGILTHGMRRSHSRLPKLFPTTGFSNRRGLLYVIYFEKSNFIILSVDYLLMLWYCLYNS